ncbi:MAG: histidine kinase response regulator hybrid protein [Bacteroidetes bacterium]|nr:histidine kinase response regulator hybrid protein [Bacteroidota bacterium]
MNKKPKILIVDDKHENLVALETVLRDVDVDLIRAYSGNEALTATLHHDFALALLDIHMPDMDGYELAGILREEEKTARLPFIFISAVYTDNLNVFKGYERGAFSFITKPFQPEILINKVKFFINIYRQEAELNQLNEDLKNKNIDLELSNKELEAFTYSVSHDLRAPLRAMNGFARILTEDHAGHLDAEGKRLLDNIGKNSEKMACLIDNLLEFSRLGKQDIREMIVDMNKLVKDVLEDLHTANNSNKTELNIQDLPKTRGDSDLLKQVFVNLLSNAIKYSSKKENPVIEVGSSTSGQETTYWVRDNGSGFDMRYKSKLFGVFQRLHSDKEFEGTGIGLAIVHRIISRSGGKVWAESEVDRGATFYVSLPSVSNVS